MAPPSQTARAPVAETHSNTPPNPFSGIPFAGISGGAGAGSNAGSNGTFGIVGTQAVFNDHSVDADEVMSPVAPQAVVPAPQAGEFERPYRYQVDPSRDQERDVKTRQTRRNSPVLSWGNGGWRFSTWYDETEASRGNREIPRG